MTVDALRSSRKSYSESIVVVHPGVQHSRELARALQEDRMIARFITSLIPESAGARLLPDGARNRLRMRAVNGIPGEKVIAISFIEIALWLWARILGNRFRDRLSYAGLALFDRIAARKVRKLRPRLVVGVENSSRHVFRSAKAVGATCVLDAASVHHSAQPARHPEADPELAARVVAGKDEEVRLADHIVVLSTHARDTYVSAGVLSERISVIAPGIWFPDCWLSTVPRRSGPGIRFLFVGNVKFAKGVDLLLAAFARLKVPGKRLLIVGPITESGLLPDPLPSGVEYLGKLERRAVFDAYADADVLVLPSRADGFGFVVPEAMTTGLPVIVSSCTGAKDLVQDGATGWIFLSGDSQALLRAMEHAAARRDELSAMGSRARKAVAGVTWEAYRERTRALYRDLISQAGSVPESERADPPPRRH